MSRAGSKERCSRPSKTLLIKKMRPMPTVEVSRRGGKGTAGASALGGDQKAIVTHQAFQLETIARQQGIRYDATLLDFVRVAKLQHFALVRPTRRANTGRHVQRPATTAVYPRSGTLRASVQVETTGFMALVVPER